MMLPIEGVHLARRTDTIHLSTCRYVRGQPGWRWVWADKNPDEDWEKTAPWLRRCQVCHPPSPLSAALPTQETP